MKNLRKKSPKGVWIVEILLWCLCVPVIIWCVQNAKCRWELVLAVVWSILLVIFGVALFLAEGYALQHQKE